MKVTMSPELTALRDEAMATSCISWALQKRWKLSPGVDRSGPCPVCGGNDRFSIHTKDNIFNCRRCGISGSGVIDLVMKTESVGFIEACERVTGRRASDPVDEARMARLRDEAAATERKRAAEANAYRERARRDGAQIWAEGRAIDTAGLSGVLDYLDRRAIDLMGTDLAQLGALRVHPDLAWTEEFTDAERDTKGWRTLHIGAGMLGFIRLPARLVESGDPLGQFGGVHMTWLDLAQPKGKLVLPPDEKGKPRPSKKVRGRKKGGAIPLVTPRGARRIVMGEGIETTLTPFVHALEPDTAYWAGIDVGNMSGKPVRRADGTIVHDEPDMADLDCFLPPDWCEELVYLGEGDDAEVHSREKCLRGLKRAKLLRQQAIAAGRQLPPLETIYVPGPEGGKDLNDIAMLERDEGDNTAAADGTVGAE